MKKVLSIVLVLTFVLTSFSSFTAVAVEETKESVYVVAGNKAEVFGLIWYKYPTATNTMTKDGDIYTFTINDVEPQTGLKFQIVENKPNGEQREYGIDQYSVYDEIHVEFRVIETCDVTITFAPDTETIDVYGAGVKLVSGVQRVCAYSENSDALGGRYPLIYPDKGEMTLGDDGVYSVTFEDIAPEENIIINIHDEMLNGLLGFYGYNPCAIDVVKNCDITIYFKREPELKNSKIWVEGDGVVIRTKPVIGDLFVRSNKWLGYECNESNKLTEVADDVYQLKVENVVGDTQYKFSFVNHRKYTCEIWGGTFNYDPIQLGVEYETKMYPYQYANSTMCFEAPYKNSNVTITLDLTDFDYVTKDGATFRIDATDMRGDLNVDGIVTIADATDVQKGLANLITFTDNQKISGDVNGDGEVTIVDVTIIQKYITKLVESFDNIE